MIQRRRRRRAVRRVVIMDGRTTLRVARPSIVTFAVILGERMRGLCPHPLPKEFLLRQALQLGRARLHVGILHRAVQVDRVAVSLFELIRMQRAVVYRVNRR